MKKTRQLIINDTNTHNIFDYLLQSGHAEDENQWNQCCPASGWRYVWYLLNLNREAC